MVLALVQTAGESPAGLSCSCCDFGSSGVAGAGRGALEGLVLDKGQQIRPPRDVRAQTPLSGAESFRATERIRHPSELPRSAFGLLAGPDRTRRSVRWQSPTGS